MEQTAAPLVLTAEDRAEPARWSQGRLPWLAERARIVLACAEPGSGVARVAAELGSTRMTVRKWRRRAVQQMMTQPLQDRYGEAGRCAQEGGGQSSW